MHGLVYQLVYCMEQFLVNGTLQTCFLDQYTCTFDHDFHFAL